MIAPRFVVLGVIVLSMLINTAGAQPTESRIIDLASQDEGSRIIQPLIIESETNLSFVIKNRLISQKYNVEFILENLAIPPIPNSLLEASSETQKNISLLESQGVDPCLTTCLAILKEIATAKDEKEIPILRNKYFAEHKGSCKGKEKMVAGFVALTDSLTSKLVGSITVKKGQQVTIIISRTTDGKEYKWLNTYTTSARGRWFVSYGFSFPWLVSREREYFTKKNSDTSFAITEKNNVSRLKYFPAVYIHWLPTSDELNNWSLSIAGGLGFDLKSPVVFLGGSLTFNQNLSVMLGGVLHQVNDLNGRYNPNEIVKENLGSEQLLEEKWVLNPCVTVAFRFESNPFK